MLPLEPYPAVDDLGIIAETSLRRLKRVFFGGKREPRADSVALAILFRLDPVWPGPGKPFPDLNHPTPPPPPPEFL